MTKPGDYANTFVDVLRALSDSNDQAIRAKLAIDEQFLRANIFRGLRVLHSWFDSPACSHFDANTFKIVIERCSRHAVTINGVEIFTSMGELIGVFFQEDKSDSWCTDLAEKYRLQPGISFCATYSLSDDLP